MDVGTGRTYKICPECRFFSSTDEKGDYCPLCGATLNNSCTKCDKPIGNPYDSYCRFCGAAFPGRFKEEDLDTEI